MLPALAACNTPAGPAEDQSTRIQFIDETPASGKSAKRNKHLVRSHVSKFNRQRTKGSAAQHLTWTEEVLNPVILKKPTVLETTQDDISNSPGDTSSGMQTGDSPPINSEDSYGHNEDSSTPLDLRSISPLFGALRTQAFTHHPFVDESANYCKFQPATSSLNIRDLSLISPVLRIILPNAFLPTQAWFKMFCNEPIVFHGFSAVCNLHLAMVDTYSARVKRQRMLIHKTEAIRLVNEKLSDLTHEDIEPVMLGMFTLYPEDEKIQKAAGRGKTAFVPHLPW